MRNDLLHQEYVQHRRELQHEAEQRRLIKQAGAQQDTMRHLVSRLGTFLIAIGTRLERVEHLPAHSNAIS